jgi:hypothetical protein
MQAILLITLLSGCSETMLSQSWQLDRVRILAASASVEGDPDPILGTRSEPRPGERVVFDALYYVPDGEYISGAIWIGCIPESELSYGCELDPTAFESLTNLDENASFEDIQTAIEAAREGGFLGFEPDMPPEWTVPEDALDGLSDAEQKEGTNAFVNIALLGDSEDPDAEPVESGFKRFPVSTADTPNHNPEITDFIVADVALDGDVGFRAQQGMTYVIEPVIPEGHIETYAYMTEDGTSEYRREEPYITWFTELGAKQPDNQARFDQEYSLYPYTPIEWTAPKKAGHITIHAVIRDRRGGMGWASLKVNVL